MLLPYRTLGTFLTSAKCSPVLRTEKKQEVQGNIQQRTWKDAESYCPPEPAALLSFNFLSFARAVATHLQGYIHSGEVGWQHTDQVVGHLYMADTKPAASALNLLRICFYLSKERLQTRVGSCESHIETWNILFQLKCCGFLSSYHSSWVREQYLLVGRPREAQGNQNNFPIHFH